MKMSSATCCCKWRLTECTRSSLQTAASRFPCHPQPAQSNRPHADPSVRLASVTSRLRTTSPPSRSMEKYDKLEKLGEGAHGVVVKARVRSEQQVRDERRRQRKREEEEEEQIVKALGQGTPKKRKFEDEVEASAVAATAAEAEALGQEPDDIRLPAPPDTIVAIKKIRLRSAAEGLSMEAVREIKLLQELNHPNVLKLMDIFNHHSNINLVLEYMKGDMEQLLRGLGAQHKPLPHGDIKAYLKMILQGMEHCHSSWILHRDMKPGNLLIGTDGCVKIADFGLAKIYGSPDRRMSPQACTIWYRAPEMLCGATSYGPAADMWSIGCIMGEMFWMKPMFAGPESEMQQLQRIFALLGTPSVADWPHVTQLRHYIHFKAQPGRTVRELFHAISDDAADLLAGLLALNPNKRLTATEALAHRYFREKPQPTPLAQLVKIPSEKAKKEAAALAAQQNHEGKPSGRTLSFD